MTEDGLEDQLLALTVAKPNPSPDPNPSPSPNPNPNPNPSPSPSPNPKPKPNPNPNPNPSPSPNPSSNQADLFKPMTDAFVELWLDGEKAHSVEYWQRDIGEFELDKVRSP